jgi:hypothetical protein
MTFEITLIFPYNSTLLFWNISIQKLTCSCNNNSDTFFFLMDLKKESNVLFHIMAQSSWTNSHLLLPYKHILHYEKMTKKLPHNFGNANCIGGHIHNQGTQKDGPIEKKLQRIFFILLCLLFHDYRGLVYDYN